MMLRSHYDARNIAFVPWSGRSARFDLLRSERRQEPVAERLHRPHRRLRARPQARGPAPAEIRSRTAGSFATIVIGTSWLASSPVISVCGWWSPRKISTRLSLPYVST